VAFQNALFDIGLDAMVGVITQLSLHSADPGTSGTDEIEGGSYERQTPQWNAATDATVAMGAPVQFQVPGGGTVVGWVGLYGDGDQWFGSIPLSQQEVFQNDGIFAVTSLTISSVNN
jgi:hypothetical protein